MTARRALALGVSLSLHGLAAYGCSARCGARSTRNSSAESTVYSNIYEYSEQRITPQFAATVAFIRASFTQSTFCFLHFFVKFLGCIFFDSSSFIPLTSMKQNIGIGIIGLGWMGQLHAQSYRAFPMHFADADYVPELVICADQPLERAQQLGQRFGFREWTEDWRNVVDHPQVDAIDVTAPNHLHRPIIEYAASRGKPVNCEKPAGAFPQDTIAAAAAMRQRGLVSCVGYNYRWAPLVQYLKQLLDSGILGEIQHYEGRFFSCYAADPLSWFSWRFEKENGPGASGDLLTHAADMAMFLAGDIYEVCSQFSIQIPQRPIPDGPASHYGKGSTQHPQGTVTNDDTVSVLTKFTSGASGILQASRTLYGPKADMSFRFYASKGYARWSFESMNELEIEFYEADEVHAGVRKIYTNPMHPYHSHFNPAPATALSYNDLKIVEIYEFLKAVNSGEPCPVGLDQAEKVARIVQAAAHAQEQKCWIKV